MRNITGSTAQIRPLIEKEDTRSDKEKFADSEIARLIPAIKDVLNIEDGWTFQDDLDAQTDRFNRLLVCEVWRNRILCQIDEKQEALHNLNKAIAARERTIKVSGSPGQRGYQLTSAVIKAQEAGIDCEIDRAGKVTVK